MLYKDKRGIDNLFFLGGSRRQEYTLFGKRLNKQGCHPKQPNQLAGIRDR